MENNKKSTVATVLLLIAVLVIGALAGYIYMQKIEADKKIADLEAKISQKQEIKEDTLNKNEIKVEGTYFIVGQENSEIETYKFMEDNVENSVYEKIKGKYEIENNKIKITYTEAYDPVGNLMDVEKRNEELIIIDENTLMRKMTIDGKLYVGVFVKE